MDVTLEDLARLVDGTVSGDGKTVIRAVNGIKEAGPGDVTFLANSKYAPLLATTKASAVILAEGTSAPLPAVTVKNPDLAFAKVAEHLSGGSWRPPSGVHYTKRYSLPKKWRTVAACRKRSEYDRGRE